MFLESGFTSLNKTGEELCGDRVETVIGGDTVTVVLADGLGSGVKANILATLTSKILCTMVASDIGIDECVDTVLQTLPVCRERGVAYSTFSVIHIDKRGEGRLFEFDNPQAVYYGGGKCGGLPRAEHTCSGRSVYVSDLRLKENDIILLMSDGAVHAGIGKLLNFGWRRDEIMTYLDRRIKPGMSARGAACLLAAACNELYVGKPGDDTTVAAVRVRAELPVSVMVGPPVDKSRDDFYVGRFLAGGGKKVVCGGTSSQIVARHLRADILADFEYPDREVPPIGHIKGIDLATEGVLTLRKLIELSRPYLSESDLAPKTFAKKDGASLLADMLFEKATKATFFVGQSINTAHQDLSIGTTMKLKLVEDLAANLKKMGKEVELFYD
ncbi:MAG: serine/threonine-protein phosphatase [Clostridiales bacterium]|jgi:hypothetical protein|nr:serine/threonine-protein phosphatase [Clostridiales bacterium]